MTPDDPDDLQAPETLEALSAAVTGRLPLPTSLRARLFANVSKTHRWEDLLDQIARDCDLDRDATEALLLTVDQPSSWEPSPLPGVQLLHFEGGPSTTNAITGFVQIEVGGTFAEHGHAGAEIVVVLQGELRDEQTKKRYGRGDRVVSGVDDVHALTAISDIPVIYLAVVQNGITLDGELIGPDDPRA